MANKQISIEDVVKITENDEKVKIQDDILFALDNMKNCVLGRTDMINNLERSEKINQIKSVAGKAFAGFLSFLPGVGGTIGQLLDCFVETSERLNKDSEIKAFVKAYDASIKKYNKLVPECEQKPTSKEIFEEIKKTHNMDNIKFNKTKNSVVKHYEAFLNRHLSKRLQEHDKKIEVLENNILRLNREFEKFKKEQLTSKKNELKKVKKAREEMNNIKLQNNATMNLPKR